MQVIGQQVSLSKRRCNQSGFVGKIIIFRAIAHLIERESSLFYVIGRIPNHLRGYSNLSFLSLGLITKVQYPWFGFFL